ncbi:MAG: hypothetical protein Q9M16_02295 [Mariprofundus sp.]|nr:hypothetical protein [Mariprofundus sp.]
MQKAAHVCHTKSRAHYTSPRQTVASLIYAMSEQYVELHPVHGLFENHMQGYRAQFQASQRSIQNRTAALSLYFYRATKQFLASNKQGELFINVELSILLKQSFIDQLNTLVQQSPALSNRLVLLLSEEDIYPDSGIERSLTLTHKQLAIAGIQLGLEINNNHRMAFLMDNKQFKIFSPACILIHYSDDWMQQQQHINALSAVIHHCRRNSWPVLADYRRQHNNRSIS